MDANEIIRTITESRKKTPVKAYVTAKKPIDFGALKTFGAGDTIVFGDWSEIEPVLCAHAQDIEDVVIENDCRNSAIPLLDKKNINERIEPGAIIRDQV